MAKAKFPNPAFWRYKDHIDWKAQGENLKEVGGIVVELIKETDWKAVAARHKKNLTLTGKRIAEEAKEIASDPLRVIRESLDRMDEAVRRTIEENRTELV